MSLFNFFRRSELKRSRSQPNLQNFYQNSSSITQKQDDNPSVSENVDVNRHEEIDLSRAADEVEEECRQYSLDLSLMRTHSTTPTFDMSSEVESKKSDEPKVSSLDEGSPSLDTLTPEQSSLTSLLRMGSMSVFFSKNDNIVQTLERKKIEEDLRSKERRETLIIRSINVWETDIIPHWEEKKNSKKVLDLCETGIPSKVRGKVWKLAIGNELNITRELFDICCHRAIQLQELKSLGKEKTLELIVTDLERTFPSLGFFQPGGTHYQELHEILGAYVCYRPDIGYVQGMSFLAAMLLLNLDTFDAFKVLCNMLNRKCHRDFFQMDLKKIEGYKAAFKSLFAEFLPALSSHLESLAIEPDLFLLEWFLTLFARSLPLEVASRVWDFYFLHGEVFLFKTALGILKSMEKKLLGQSFEEVAKDLTHLPLFEEKEFFKTINLIQLTEKKFDSTIMKFVIDSI